MKKPMLELSRVRADLYGPIDFWQDVAAEFAAAKPRDYLTYEQWRGLMKKAQQCGLVRVYADSNGEASPHFHSPLGMALLQLYRRLKQAKAEGLSPFQFHSREVNRIDSDTENRRRLDEAQRQQHAARIATQGRLKKGRGRASIDDEEIDIA